MFQLLVLISQPGLCASITDWWREKGGAGLTEGHLCFRLLLECCATRDPIRGYAVSLDLVRSKTSMTKTHMTLSIPLAQLSLLRSTRVSTSSLTSSLELLKSISNVVCPNVGSCTVPSPTPALNPASLPAFLRKQHLIRPVPHTRRLRGIGQYRHPAPSIRHPVPISPSPLLSPPTLTTPVQATRISCLQLLHEFFHMSS